MFGCRLLPEQFVQIMDTLLTVWVPFWLGLIGSWITGCKVWLVSWLHVAAIQRSSGRRERGHYWVTWQILWEPVGISSKIENYNSGPVSTASWGKIGNNRREHIPSVSWLLFHNENVGEELKWIWRIQHMQTWRIVPDVCNFLNLSVLWWDRLLSPLEI